jgi:hypothetical protein
MRVDRDECSTECWVRWDRNVKTLSGRGPIRELANVNLKLSAGVEEKTYSFWVRMSYLRDPFWRWVLKKSASVWRERRRKEGEGRVYMGWETNGSGGLSDRREGSSSIRKAKAWGRQAAGPEAGSGTRHAPRAWKEKHVGRKWAAGCGCEREVPIGWGRYASRTEQ